MWRVSSAAIKSTLFSVSMARSVISCRFPMGVGTTLNTGYSRYQPSEISAMMLLARSEAALDMACRSIVTRSFPLKNVVFP